MTEKPDDNKKEKPPHNEDMGLSFNEDELIELMCGNDEVSPEEIEKEKAKIAARRNKSASQKINSRGPRSGH